MRKGHGSTKVPGVKLRPAAPKKPGANSKEANVPAYLLQDDSGITEEKIIKSSKKPLAKVVICSSGVPEKAALFAKAVELGAQTSSDLTDRVTHLIAMGPGSAKYSYCVGHGVPIMKPSWILKAYDKWISGESITAKQQDDHRLPVFTSATLCLTGIDDIDVRTRINKLMTKNGGVFVKDLTSNSKITHLLCGSERGEDVDERGWTRKMQHAEKQNGKYQDRKISLVWEEWFWDSIEFGGQIDESRYDVTRPRPERKTKRDSTPLLQPISSLADNSNGPIRKRSALPTPTDTIPEQADDEELFVAKRPADAAARMWGGLMKSRGLEMRGNSFVRSSSKQEPSLAHVDNDGLHEPDTADVVEEKERPGTMLSAFKRTKSFAPSTASKASGAAFAEPGPSKPTVQRVKSTPPEASSSRLTLESVTEVPTNKQSEKPPSELPPLSDRPIPFGEKYLFVGYKFVALGEVNNPHILQEIQVRGGSIVDEKHKADFLLVRLSSGKALRDNEQNALLRPRYRTECWLEQCIFEERVCDVKEHVAFSPLEVAVPIPGAQQLKVHISGFPAHQKTMTTRLIKAIGATVSDQLSRKATQMISTSNSTAKYLKAQEWGIPCVNIQWLLESAKAGTILAPESYGVEADVSQTTGEPKGPIRDITNDDFAQGSSKCKSPQKAAVVLTESVYQETSKSAPWLSNGLLSNASEFSVSRPSNSLTRKSSSSSLSRKATEIDPSLDQMPQQDAQRFASPAKLDARLSGLQANASSFASSSLHDEERVPSSNTPSPLKAPTPMKAHVPRTAPTPMKPAIKATMSSPAMQSTHALKSAITSLLGKRSASDEHDVSGQAARAPKRSKPPPRSKSKPDSASRASSTSHEPSAGSSLTSYPLFPSDVIKPFNIDQESRDESMRVTYEDPKQRDEQRRLMSLLGAGSSEIPPHDDIHTATTTESVPAEKKGRNLVRRSSRKSGL